MSFSMRPQDAITNTFGFAGPIYSYFTPPPIAIGNASASNSAPKGALNIAGETMCDFGYATAMAGESEAYNLGNLTGSGGPTGPPKTQTITVNYALSYDLKTHIDDPAEDSAKEELIVVVTGVKFSKVLADIPLSGNDHKSGNIANSFTLELPANSVTRLTADFGISGVAETVCPPPPVPPNPPLPAPPVPEPSTCVLLGLGGLGLVGYQVRARRVRTRK
jgi:hypothetical protein